jgi:multidrug efflux pump subunit AcrA (membrane-fusion protein)
VVTAVDVTVGQAPPSSAAITMRSDSLTVVVQVAEQDVPTLKVGQTAQVTVTALSQTVPAKVTALPTSASTSSTGSGAVTFPLSLALSSNPDGILPGMTASIAIVTATAKNVLSVPSTAIQGTSPDNTVQVMVNGTPQSMPVSIGLSTNSSTEVISGLQVGQTVVTGVVNPTASTTTTGGTGGLSGRTGLGGNGFPGGARPGG